MTDEELIVLYEAYESFGNLLPGTINVRHSNMLKFSREVGFSEATEAAVMIWLSRPISAKTRNLWISTLNTFYTWANKYGHLSFNPVANISKPRLHPKQPRPMPADDIQNAVAQADPLMKCWLLLGAYAGCRCQEIAGMEREDVFDAMGQLHIVHGKGDKERWVPLHADVLAALLELPMPDAGRLWNETAASISRKGNRYLHSLGIKSTMHTLRHWYGTHVYQASKDLRLTQELMGHSSPTTTSVYAAPDQTKAAGVVGLLNIK